MELNNTYYILRHGESLPNVREIISCWPEKSRFPLTQKGRKEIKKVAEKLKNQKIDLIFASDLLRTKQTAEIVSKTFKIKPRFDKRLREYNVGVFNGKKIEEFRKYFPAGGEKRFKEKPKKGETYIEMSKRMFDFLKEINRKYKGKNILIISHQLPLTFLEGKVRGFSDRQTLKKIPKEKRISTGELRLL